ncbi:MAG: hypothetical protein U5K79_07315 [Cyclobacteriaceae bacterium]|nr:hypothetical protein [Cyclobacteriaceae bacterium]
MKYLMNSGMLLVFLIGIVLTAQAQKETSKKWNFIVEPYMMFPYMSGETGIRNLPSVNVDADPGDIFSRLQIGTMLYLEAKNDSWAITSDLLYMDLEQDATPTTVINSGKVKASQLGYELTGL